MAEMTREEFVELAQAVVGTGENLHWNERIAEDEYTVSARDADATAWSALLAAYDALAARIAKLETACSELVTACQALAAVEDVAPYSPNCQCESYKAIRQVAAAIARANHKEV
jgi:thymidine phosphorylase